MHPSAALTVARRPLTVDNFCGGGGTATGIEMATGYSPDVAINHDPPAIAMHRANHPDATHYNESVWDIDPVEVTDGEPVALCWLSPDCKHFSKAKGGQPVAKQIRGLAWVALKWAATVKPWCIMLENVEEFQGWGPVLASGRPCPDRKGETFRTFVRALQRHGYHVDWRELRACDYGAPTIRKRLFLVARCDGRPIRWPEQTHAAPTDPRVLAGQLLPYRTGAECIDWSNLGHSVFLSADAARVVGVRRPLADKTLRRLARGMRKFVLDCANPFVVQLPADGGPAAPFITEHANGSSQRNMAANEPLRTICASVKGGHFALVAANLVKLRGTCRDGQPLTEPAPTITAGGNHLAMASYLLKYYGCGEGQAVNEPMHTVTTRERFARVDAQIAPESGLTEQERYQAWWCARFIEEYDPKPQPRLCIPFPRPSALFVGDTVVVDILMRMLTPRELFNAQGFGSDYQIERDADGNRISKQAQVARCGNAVPPVFSKALVEANLPELCRANQAVA